jgi:hypothetical protein
MRMNESGPAPSAARHESGDEPCAVGEPARRRGAEPRERQERDLPPVDRFGRPFAEAPAADGIDAGDPEPMARWGELDQIDDETVDAARNVLAGVELMNDQMFEHGPKGALRQTDRKGVRRRAALLVLLAALPVGVAQASTPSLTAHRAELHVLGSPRVFWQWGGAARRLVNPTTRLMRTGTRATCRRLRVLSYTCTVHNGADAVRLVYIGRKGGAFTLRRH